MASPTGFTYRERKWWLVTPYDSRRTILAALREAKLEGFSHTNGHGGTRHEIKTLLASALEKRAEEMKPKKRRPAGTVNSLFDDFPPLEPHT